MSNSTACLGLEWLGQCSYDPAAPNQSYFTIGQLVSVIALLLAFSQLTKPIIQFRIMARQTNYWTAIAICVAAICFVFIAAILPFIPGKAWPLLGYPVFWEILAGLCFVSVAGFLISAISRKPQFNPGRTEAYLKACMAVVVKANDEDLRELAEEIVPAIQPIFKECSSYDARAVRQAEARGEKHQIPESVRNAVIILDLWSDGSFCRNVVCKAPETALKIIDELAQQTSHNGPGYALSQQLIHQAFVNRDSLLMREEDFAGLGFFKMFRNTVFGNWSYIESDYRPLEAWRTYEEPVNKYQAKKYAECLATSFRAYFSAKQFWKHPYSLASGINNLAEMSIRSFNSDDKADEDKFWRSDTMRILNEIETGFEKLVDIVEEHQDIIPTYRFNDSEDDQSKDVSIYGVLADGIYSYFEKLAMLKRHDRAIRQCAIGIWLRIFGVPTATQSTAAREIGNRLIYRLNAKIDDNLNLNRRYYPAMTRLLISLNGIYEPQEDAKDPGSAFHRRFIGRLKREYSKLAKAYPQFAADLLPEHATYDKENNELRLQGLRYKVHTLKLASADEACEPSPS